MGSPFLHLPTLTYAGVHALVASSYLLFRSWHGGGPCAARAPSHVLAPWGLTQEFDVLFFTCILAAQRARRASSSLDVLHQALLYLQLACGALLVLTESRLAVTYSLLLVTAWVSMPAPALPLHALGFARLTPYELAVIGGGGAGAGLGGTPPGPSTASAPASQVILAAMGVGDVAAVPVSTALRGAPGVPQPLWYADLQAWPDLAPALQVDCGLLSLELPSVLQGTRRLPLKSQDGERVETVVLSSGNLRRYFIT